MAKERVGGVVIFRSKSQNRATVHCSNCFSKIWKQKEDGELTDEQIMDKLPKTCPYCSAMLHIGPPLHEDKPPVPTHGSSIRKPDDRHKKSINEAVQETAREIAVFVNVTKDEDGLIHADQLFDYIEQRFHVEVDK